MATLTLRPSEERGFADHDWLKSYHTFSFASYYDPRHESWGSLRVINEDRVAASQGFPTHHHKEFEIFSFILDGQLEHKDSMGNIEVLKRGDVQMTSAGTGISHSEYNHSSKESVHFLQIWAKPNKKGLSPAYYTRHFPDDVKRNVLLPIVAPAGSTGVEEVREDGSQGPAPVHSDLYAYTSVLSPGATVSRQADARCKRAYLHLATTAFRHPGIAAADEDARVEIKVGSGEAKVLKEGDGLYIDFSNAGEGREVSLRSLGQKDASLVYFEMAT